MLLGLFIVADLSAQTTVNMPYNSGLTTFTLAPPTLCTFNFFDNGGAAGNYSNSSNPTLSVVTFAPSNPATHRIRATFTSYNTEGSFDALYIYNGNAAETPNLTNTGVQTVLPNQFNSGSPINLTFRAGGYQGAQSPGTLNATMPSGALTFQFDSDASVVLAGWVATIAQVPIAGCGMTAPANATVSTGLFNCLADAVVSLPTFNPAGCQSALTVRYSVDGGTPVVIPQPLPATLTIPGLASGAHTITWTLVDPCGNVVVATVTNTVTVQDLVPPTITCPNDIIQTLSPGECEAIVGYSVGVTDNCPFFVQGPAYQLPASFQAHGGGVAYSLSGNTLPGGVYFNLTNNGADALSVTGFGVRFGNPAFGIVNAPQTMQVYVSNGNTYVGVETNAAAWTNIGPAIANPIPPYFATGAGPLAQLDITSDIQIAPGATKAFHIFGASACPIFNYFSQTGPQTNGPWTMQGGPVSFGLLSNLLHRLVLLQLQILL